MARKTPWFQTLSHLVSEHRAPPGGRRSLSPKPRTPAGRAFPLLAIALVAALAVGVLVFWPGGSQPAEAQSAETIEYEENSTGLVATFIAEDPEDNKVTWTLGGEDDHRLSIDEDGVLTFNEPPDYDYPADDNSDNTYELIVIATETTDTTVESNPFPVKVRVTNVDEQGKVVWDVDHDADGGADEPKLVQFQVGAILTASVTDGDVPSSDKDVSFNTNVQWKWYRSADKTSGGTAIDGAISDEYAVTDDDVDMYLRAEATYVLDGRTDTASQTSDYPVLAAAAADAAAPKFAPANVTRKVDEGKKGMMVGAPVTATGGHGALNYTLGGADDELFEIDQETGQITTMAALNFEDNTCTRNSCVVEVTATDASGAPSDPAATVTIKLVDVDEKPVFEEVSETFDANEMGTAIPGASFEAVDPEEDLVSLSPVGPDGRLFRLDSSGNLEFKARPDYENPQDKNRDNVYEVTVRANVDGSSKYADLPVKVTVENSEEPPVISGKAAVSFKENGTGRVASFEAEDPEGDPVTGWDVLVTAPADIDTLEGFVATDFTEGDNVHFDISKDGVLTFDVGGDTGDPDPIGAPDYENPQGGSAASTCDATADPNPCTNTYKVVVSVSDKESGGMTGYYKVTVTVTNVNEDGKVTWTVDPDGTGALVAADVNGGDPIAQFQAGALLTASATDDEIPGNTKTVTVADHTLSWQWYSGGTRLADDATGVSGEAYTVQPGDVGKRIRVVASYTIDSKSKTPSLTSEHRVLETLAAGTSELEFDPTTPSRKVDEGEKGMRAGARVQAKDSHGELNYILTGTGADNAKFKIDPKTGQITSGVDLDYDTAKDVTATAENSCDATAAGEGTECEVTVTATDAAGETATATVTINIQNVDEAPDPKGDRTPEIPEGDTLVPGEYTAVDPDGFIVKFALRGHDSGLFRLTADKQLAFRTPPDREDPQDRGRNNVYDVTIRASDGTKHADLPVKVTVTDVNEKPEVMLVSVSVSGPASATHEENSDSALGAYEASETQARLSLTGDDASHFRLSGGMLSFSTAPDYENPMDADTDNTYKVTVMATHMAYGQTYMAEQMVTVTVTNVDEMGMVSLSSMSPSVGTEITAMLTDPDGGVSDTTWQWSKSMTMDGEFMDIDDATMMTYTPVAADDGYYLMAKAMYTDGHGAGKMAMAKTDSAVVTNEDQQGMVTLSTMEPVAGTAVTATLTDADEVVGSVDWQWSRSMTMDGTFEHISAETDSYTPTVADIGYYLKVRATYTDGHGSGKIAEVTADMAVRDPLVARYDINKNGMIDKAEVIAAIDDYLFNETLTKPEVIRLIDLYLFGRTGP